MTYSEDKWHQHQMKLLKDIDYSIQAQTKEIAKGVANLEKFFFETTLQSIEEEKKMATIAELRSRLHQCGGSIPTATVVCKKCGSFFEAYDFYRDSDGKFTCPTCRMMETCTKLNN